MNYKFPLDVIRSYTSESGIYKPERLPEENESFKQLNSIRNELELEPNNIERWGVLFNNIDRNYDELISKIEESSLVNTFKSFSYNCYSTLLERFPLLTDYWKNWSIFEYKINGIESSINILSLSVQKFPTSMELWADYLSALISQFESIEDEILKNEQIEHIRFQYGIAIMYNGAHYNSNIIWDKIFEFETSLDIDSKISKQLLLKVIKLPLYEYSKYFKKYFQINKEFELEELLDRETLSEYLNKLGKLTVGELSDDEKSQIIDDYSYEIFNNIQNLVNEKWNFESSLVYQSFSIKDISEIESEVGNWINYLDYEIKNFQNEKINLELVENLFERAMIPNCFNSKLWFKYLLFYHNSNLEEPVIFEKMNSLYQRCCQKYLPLNDFELRTSYVDFLMSYDRSEEANEFIIDLIKIYNSNGSTSLYFKEEYIKSVSKLMELWFETSENEESFINTCEDIIKTYFKKSEPQPKRANTESATVRNENNLQGINKYKDIILSFINDDSICLIINRYLETSFSLSTAESIKNLRIFFNTYFREKAVEQSVKFWKFFIEFEGIYNVNFKNLKNLIDYIKDNINLPKAIIDSLIDLYYDIINSNLPLAIQSNTEIPRSIIEQDMNKSNSIFINLSLRKRMSNNNHYVKDLKDSKSYKSQNLPPLLTGEEFLKIVKKHSNHPGILVEALPEITNSLLDNDKFYALDTPRVSIPPLPTFKNVEKASLPINYPLE